MATPKKLLSDAEAHARVTEMHRRCLQVFRPKEPLTVSQWADRHYVFSTQPGALPGQWRTTPYQRAILDMGMGHDDVRIVTFMKSARVGYSTMLRIFVGYHLAHEPRQVLMYLPTESDAKNAMRVHIEPTMRNVPVLAELVNPSGRGGYNLEHRKTLRNGLVLHVLGGKSARNYREHTKDIVIYDELDGFDSDIEKEGSPTSLGDARVTNSPWRKSIRGSTPTTQATSKIEQSADTADARFYRHLPCPACAAMHPLTWGQLKWTDRDENTVRHHCPSCDHPAEYSDLNLMDRHGQWIAEDGTWIDEAAGVYKNTDNNEVPAPQHVAFNIWAAYSPFQPWRELVREHYKAIEASKHGDHTVRKSFTNLRLGESWTEPGTEVEPNWLLTRVEPYRKVPDAVHCIVAGVDVQVDRLEVEVLGIGEDTETWSLAYEVLTGDTKHRDVWEDLDNLFATEYEREDGELMQISAMAIDEGFNTDTVRGYCASRFSRKVYAIKGVGGFDKQLTDKPKRWPVAHLSGVRCPVIPLGVDSFKQLVYRQLLVGTPGPGFQHFPDRYGLKYFEGITAEKLVTRDRSGRPVDKWEVIRARNEPLDCRVYALAAYRIFSPRDTVTNKVRKKPPRYAKAGVKAPPVKAPAPEHVQAAAAAPKRPRREPRPRRSSFLGNRNERWL